MSNEKTRNEQRKNNDKTPPARRKAPHAEQRAIEAVEIREAKEKNRKSKVIKGIPDGAS